MVVHPDPWEADVQGWSGQKLQTYLQNKLKAKAL
jgi:hypothetical protein